MTISPWKETTAIVRPASDAVVIYQVDKSTISPQVDKTKLLAPLSTDEIERYNKFRFDKDKLTFGIARFALRYICGQMLTQPPASISFDYNEFGKPYLPGVPNFHFNLSHSGSLILLAFCNHAALGIDVEKYKHHVRHMDLAKSVFADSEMEQLKSLETRDIIHGFYNCWSKKESFIKAKGKGLQIPLSQFGVRIVDEGYANLLHVNWETSEIFKWQLFNLATKQDYAAACTCHIHINTVELFDISQFISGNVL